MLPRGIGEKSDRALRHLVLRIERMKESAHAVLDHFGQSTDVGGDDRHFARHRLERGETEALLRRRQQEDVCNRQQRHDLFLRAHRVHEVTDPELARPSLRQGQVGPIADQQQPRRHLLLNAIENVHDRFDALDRPKVGDVDDDLVSGRRRR